MSAFVVHDDHLRLLTQAGLRWLGNTDPGKLLAELFQLNCGSVAHRYRQIVEPVLWHLPGFESAQGWGFVRGER